jgi:hypothetical protein
MKLHLKDVKGNNIQYYSIYCNSDIRFFIKLSDNPRSSWSAKQCLGRRDWRSSNVLRPEPERPCAIDIVLVVFFNRLGEIRDR